MLRKWLDCSAVCALVLLLTILMMTLTAAEFTVRSMEPAVPVLERLVGQEDIWTFRYEQEELALDESVENEKLEESAAKPGLEEAVEESSEESGTPGTENRTEEPSEDVAEEATEPPVEEATENPTEEATEVSTEEATETSAEEATEASAAEAVEKPAEKEAEQPEFPYYIKVNRQQNCITVYTLDEDGAYTVPYKAMVCSTGLYNATPTGTFQISTKYRWRELFGGVYGQYATRIHGGILFHSVPYYTKSNANLCTDKYNKLGEQASMGCVRLTTADAKWIAENCPSGTTVEIYDSEDPGPLGKPEAIRLDPEDPNRGWDPTDPDENNPWLANKE
ncbi:MAG: L,D-transpeptidase [Roseburia sp.]